MSENGSMKASVRKRSGILNKRIWLQAFMMLYDFFAIIFSYFFALFLRFDFQFKQIPETYFSAYRIFIWRYALFAIVIFWLCRMYNSLWRYASYDELIRVFLGTFLTGTVHAVGITWLLARMPISYYLTGIVMQFLMTLGVRFAYRFVRAIFGRKPGIKHKTENVMIIGAGDAGTTMLREITTSREISMRACCVVDDDKNKWGLYIKGVPVVGGRDVILAKAKEYDIDTILYCIPTATRTQTKEILNICKDTGCDMRILPGVYQFATGDVSVSKTRKVEIEDLLGREPISVNLDIVLGYVQGRTVLVTGGGGSIGSELCRQIAAHDPKQLIIFDIYENTTYDLQQELKRKFPELKLVTLIGSVRNTHRVDTLFATYRPDIVFHAAAHKHVPLMEDSPNEAIKNNVFGTLNCAKAAQAYGVKRFVLISTDKAVNPTNIMGATKRLCEMIIQGMAKTTTGTEFVAVRFGNVLGSNGSVIPLFKKQIGAGGPVTVTDKNIIRYFMTIPEAVSLVLQAGAYAKGGEIFVLDMGEPVKIDDLARNLIKLSGYKVDEDIKIVYTGLRPGEKLYEELLMDEEGLQDTENKLIHIGKPIEFDERQFFEDLKELKEKAYEDSDAGREMVQRLVPTYTYKKCDRE